MDCNYFQLDLRLEIGRLLAKITLVVKKYSKTCSEDLSLKFLKS